MLRPKMQLVFQEPFDSLDPQMTVGGSLPNHCGCILNFGEAERDDRVIELLKQSGSAARNSRSVSASIGGRAAAARRHRSGNRN